jgi:nicotinamidase/pyrazinamidase
MAVATPTGSESEALLVIDLQHDFLPGGALAVPAGDDIVLPIATLAPRFTTVVATQDFHPTGHVSFASAHPGAQVFQAISLDRTGRRQQALWPDHCVAGTKGAALAAELPDSALSLILRKGTRRGVDSYSAFREDLDETGVRRSTGLGAWLRARGIGTIYLAGLARDYCVRASAIDAAAEGFEVILLDALTRAVWPDRHEETDRALAAAGVRRYLQY